VVDHADRTGDQRGGRPRRRQSDVAGAVHTFVEAAEALPIDRLADVASLAAEATGARAAGIYIADYAQRVLKQLVDNAVESVVSIDASILGRVFQSGEAYVGEGHIAVSLIEGRDRVGVVEYRYERGATGSVEVAEAVSRALLLILVSKRRYTDLVLRTRRAQPLTTAAEMQWDLLPPLACRASGASLAGIVEPAYSTGGDSFDFAVNGDLLEFIVIDAVGHGMPAVLKSIAAITTYRNVRRERGGLVAVYDEIGRVMMDQFGDRFYATGLIGSLRMTTGELTWINAGHPQPLLVRDGSAQHKLWCAPSLPMGLGGTVREVRSVMLRAGDRLLVYTDGVVDRRGDPNPAPHLDPLTDQLVDATIDTVTIEETLRRLVRSVLESCGGDLDDDATLVLVEFHGVSSLSESADRVVSAATATGDSGDGARRDQRQPE
jgi:serine phosphatase RsbU (regulator of sigma subunit)